MADQDKHDAAFESELNATLMMLERKGAKVMVVGVISALTTEGPPGSRAGSLCKAVSDGTTRSDAEVFIHTLRREADRIEKMIGGLSTDITVLPKK